jgi:hypothetical protein
MENKRPPQAFVGILVGIFYRQDRDGELFLNEKFPIDILHETLYNMGTSKHPPLAKSS